MNKKKMMSLAILGLAVFGGYKAYQNIKAKGGLMAALKLKKTTVSG